MELVAYYLGCLVGLYHRTMRRLSHHYEDGRSVTDSEFALTRMMRRDGF